MLRHQDMEEIKLARFCIKNRNLSVYGMRAGRELNHHLVTPHPREGEKPRAPLSVTTVSLLGLSVLASSVFLYLLSLHLSSLVFGLVLCVLWRLSLSLILSEFVQSRWDSVSLHVSLHVSLCMYVCLSWAFCLSSQRFTCPNRSLARCLLTSLCLHLAALHGWLSDSDANPCPTSCQWVALSLRLAAPLWAGLLFTAALPSRSCPDWHQKWSWGANGSCGNSVLEPKYNREDREHTHTQQHAQCSDTLSHINSLMDALTSHPAPPSWKDLLPRAGSANREVDTHQTQTPSSHSQMASVADST